MGCWLFQWFISIILFVRCYFRIVAVTSAPLALLCLIDISLCALSQAAQILHVMSMFWLVCVTFIYTHPNFIFYFVPSYVTFHYHFHCLHFFFLVMVVQIYICAGPGGTSNVSTSPHVSISRAQKCAPVCPVELAVCKVHLNSLVIIITPFLATKWFMVNLIGRPAELLLLFFRASAF